MKPAGPLSGFRVVDITQGLCGPFCSMHLGDAGADVIKVEPLEGDCTRRMGPHFIQGDSAIFLALNRNKKSVALDLAKREGRSILHRLLRTADVFLEDLVPSELEQLDCEYGKLAEGNPSLIYCAISAFGEEGPLKDLPGAELVIQAMSEYTASLGRLGDPPVRVGADIANLNTAMFANQAICAALYHRERTGEGQKVSVSMFGTLLHMRGIRWHAVSNPDDWSGLYVDDQVKAPDHGYQTKTGRLLFYLREGTTEDFDRLMLSLGMDSYLNDPRFAGGGRDAISTGRYAHETKPIWEKAFSDKPLDEVIELIRSCGGDAIPMMDYSTVVNHPQVLAIDAIRDVRHPTAGSFKAVGPVARFSVTPLSVERPPPLLGQHTEEILLTLGLSESELQELRAAATIRTCGNGA